MVLSTLRLFTEPDLAASTNAEIMLEIIFSMHLDT